MSKDKEEQVARRFYRPPGRLGSLAALVVSGALVASGCSGSAATNAPASAADQSPVAAASQAARSGSAAPITLTFWDHSQQAVDLANAYTKAAADFKALYPNVTVNIETTPYDQYHDKLLTALKGGTGPDIMGLDQPWVPEFASAGVLLPVDDLVTKSTAVKQDAFYPSAWDTTLWKGKQYGVPLGVDVWSMLVWNPDLFKAAGLDPKTPPKTWDELLQYAQKLTGNGVFGVALPGAKSEVLSIFMDMFTYSNGGKILNDDGTVAVNSPQAAQALDFLYHKLIKYAPNGAANLDHGTAESLFTSGKVAMMFDGNWAQETLNSQAKFDWQGATVPVPAAGGTFHGATGGWDLAINAKSPNADMAFKFVEYLTTRPEVQDTIAENTPALIAAAANYMPTRKFPAVIQDLAQNGMARPKTPIYNSISLIQQNGIQKIIGGADINATLADMQKEMQDALASQ